MRSMTFSNLKTKKIVITKMKQIGTKIKELRLKRGVTQRKMASDLGVSVQTIWNLENGKYFSDKTFAKIVEYLGVHVEIKIHE